MSLNFVFIINEFKMLSKIKLVDFTLGTLNFQKEYKTFLRLNYYS